MVGDLAEGQLAEAIRWDPGAEGEERLQRGQPGCYSSGGESEEAVGSKGPRMSTSGPAAGTWSHSTSIAMGV